MTPAPTPGVILHVEDDAETRETLSTVLQHAGVRQFAAGTLPAVMEHLAHAKMLHARFTGAGPPVPSAAAPQE